ncbi:MAG: ABC transporter ATP-binding protein [Burkholderiales bacterium]|nr:ABC transporter ATP-binding protein [Burkholderiales bacterium]
MALLEVRGLTARFAGAQGDFAAVDGVGFSVEAGQTLALVGESGSGKSVTALSLMGLVAPPGRVTAGSVKLEGRELIGLPRRELQALRGGAMAMVFQEPMSSLNPAFTIGAQIVEALRRHQRLGAADARARAQALLERVRIPAPGQRLDEYPHKLSGGMRQRAMIAMALANDPRLLIADEPTTALDVTIQAQILTLMHELQQTTGAAIVLITHDLGVVAEVSDAVAVMYGGRIVEQAPVRTLFEQPQHPYTVGLLGSMPRLHGRADRLAAIPGQVPGPLARPPGCAFADRCPFAEPACRAQVPALRELAPGHASACRRAPLDPQALRARPLHAQPA